MTAATESPLNSQVNAVNGLLNIAEAARNCRPPFLVRHRRKARDALIVDSDYQASFGAETNWAHKRHAVWRAMQQVVSCELVKGLVKDSSKAWRLTSLSTKENGEGNLGVSVLAQISTLSPFGEQLADLTGFPLIHWQQGMGAIGAHRHQ